MPRRSIDALLRTTQAYCTQLCDKHTLDFGIAYYCDRYPRVAELNQFREVVLEPPVDSAAAVRQAEDWFRAKGIRCSRWATAGGEAAPLLVKSLAAHGYEPVQLAVFVLTRWVDGSPPSDVRVVPARAMRAAWSELLVGETTGLDERAREETQAARLERLDNPQYDGFVALVDGRPAGRCALFQVGDLARVMDLRVGPGFVIARVGQALVRHALALAKRLMMKNNYVLARPEDAERIALLESLGFERDGDIVEFVRADAPEASGGLD